MRRALTVLAITTVLSGGCALLSALPEAREAPRVGDATRISGVTISDDRRSIRLHFTGGREFDPDDLCTKAYEATVDLVDGLLEIGVFALVHPKPPKEGDSCTLMGHPRELTIELREPYHGASVRDVTGEVLELAAP
jgi:hypothetical protein